MEKELPDEIIIELTNKCNLNCEFCMKKQKESSNVKDMSFNHVKKILLDVKKSGVESVRLSGGEPFLYPNFEKTLKAAKYLGLKVIVNTNGLLINQDNLKLFKYIDIVLVSWHNIENSKVIFDKVKEISKFKTKIMLCTIVNIYNIQKLEEYYKFFKENFNEIREKMVWFLLRPIPNKLNKEPISKKNVEKLVNKIKKFNDKYMMKIFVANSLPFCVCGEKYEKEISDMCVGGKFDCGRTRLLVDVEGNYHLDYFTSKIGNVENEKILRIWNNLTEIQINSNCNNCDYLDKCNGALGKNDYLLPTTNIKQINKLNSNKKVSVVIPIFNDRVRVKLLLQSLLNQTFKHFEVIIVDDGSSCSYDDIISSYVLKGLEIDYLYIDNPDKFGAGKARNKGALMAKSDNLIFLDQDCVPDKNLIKKYLDNSLDYDVILGYIAGYGINENYDFNWIKDNVNTNTSIRKILLDFRKNIFDANLYNANYTSRETWKYFCSGNFYIKKDLFLKYKFDESLEEWGAEDIDLGYRLIKNNINILFSRDSLAFNNSSSNMLNRYKLNSLINSLVYVYKKHQDIEIMKYCLERFYFSPLKLRINSKLFVKTDKINYIREQAKAFIRVDDVYKLTRNLKTLIEFAIKHNTPLNLQVVPKLLEKSLVDFILKVKEEYPEIININQHGYNHVNHEGNDELSEKYFIKSEFGNSRSYDDQKNDISEGMEILYNNFGDNFSKIFTPPYYGFNTNTLKIINELKFNLISVKDGIFVNEEFANSLNENVDFIKDYRNNTQYSLKEINQKINNAFLNESHIGIVIHPDIIGEKGINIIKNTILDLQKKNVYFTSMEQCYKSDISNKFLLEINKEKIAKLYITNDLYDNLVDCMSVLKLIKNQLNAIKLDLKYLKNNILNFNRVQKSIKQIITFCRDNDIEIDLKLARHQSILLEKMLLGPEELSIDFYNHCNLSCKFCGIHSSIYVNKKKVSKSLSFQKVKEILDDAYSLGVEMIRVSSDGEPLMCDYSKDILKYIVEKKFKIYLMTNGVFLTEDIIKTLTKSNNSELLINFSAAREETYSEICSGAKDSFKKVLKSLSSLYETRESDKTLYTKIKFGLVYIINKYNYKEVLEYLKLLKKYKIDSVYFKFAILYENMENMLLNDHDIEILKPILKEAIAFANANLIKTNIDELFFNIDDRGFSKRYNIQEHILNVKENKCFNSWFFGRIDTFGNYYICCRETIPVGNLHKNRLSKIFELTLINKVIKEGLMGIDVTKRMWHKCNYCYHSRNNEKGLKYYNERIINYD